MKIRIVIVDDHAILRAGIRALLQLHDDFRVVSEAANAVDALREVQAWKPDVVLMDIGLPGKDGLAATREITQACPGVRVLILTQHENPEYVLPALHTGASGYVLKRAPDDTLIRAIRAVHSGGTYLDPGVSEVFMGGFRSSKGSSSDDPYDSLTEREREVLVLLAEGKTYQEVGETLFISIKTVDFHRGNLMRKLGLQNRAELVRFAAQRGLFNLSQET